MAPSKVEKKRKRKSRTRVAASPPSSSDSEEQQPSSPPPSPPSHNNDKQSRRETQGKTTRTQPPDEPPPAPAPPSSSSEAAADADPSALPAATTPTQAVRDPEEAFADLYLRRSAVEFASDLDKLRGASDFRGEASVGLLVRALRQGTRCFAREERERVGRAVGEAPGG